MLFFRNYLYTLDLFQLPNYFYFNNRPKQSSSFGLICSFGIYLFILINFFKSDLFLKNSPIVISQNLHNLHSNLIQFTPNNLMVFTVSDISNNNFYDPSIFYLIYKHIFVKSNGFGTTQIIHTQVYDLKNCSEEDMAFDPSLYKTMSLKNAYCLKNKTFELEGSWTESEIKYTAVSINLCENKTSNVICKSSEQIQTFFTESFKFFGVKYHNARVDINDYNNPIKIGHRIDFQLLDTSLLKKIYIYIKELEVLTDDGWFSIENKRKVDYTFAEKETDYETRKLINQPLFEIIFYASNTSQRNSIRYQKLPETLGSLTGMVNLLTGLCFIWTRLMVYVNSLKQVVNKLYSFPEVNRTKKRTEKMRNSRLLKNNLNYKGNKENIYADIANEKESDHSTIRITLKKKIEDKYNPKKDYFQQKTSDSKQNIPNSCSSKMLCFFQKVNYYIINTINSFGNTKKITNQFKVKFFEYLYFELKRVFGCGLSRKEQLINKAEKVFLKEMDIVSILGKIQEIDKLKIVLFDETQVALFNYLSKPLIFINQNDIRKNKNVSLSQINMTRLMKRPNEMNISECYQKVLKEKENGINERLLKLVDEKMYCDQRN